MVLFEDDVARRRRRTGDGNICFIVCVDVVVQYFFPIIGFN